MTLVPQLYDARAPPMKKWGMIVTYKVFIFLDKYTSIRFFQRGHLFLEKFLYIFLFSLISETSKLIFKYRGKVRVSLMAHSPLYVTSLNYARDKREHYVNDMTHWAPVWGLFRCRMTCSCPEDKFLANLSAPRGLFDPLIN